MGSITADTVIHVVLRKPPRPAPKPRKKKNDRRKKEDIEAEVIEENEREDESAEQSWLDDGKSAPKGTTSAHYIKFINEMLDIMDEIGDMKGCYIVMDNCNIHKNKYM